MREGVGGGAGAGYQAAVSAAKACVRGQYVDARYSKTSGPTGSKRRSETSDATIGKRRVEATTEAARKQFGGDRTNAKALARVK